MPDAGAEGVATARVQASELQPGDLVFYAYTYKRDPNEPITHVAISAGNGWCWSTDILRPGRWDRVRIDDLAKRWNMKYLGWSETLNGVRVHPHIDFNPKAA